MRGKVFQILSLNSYIIYIGIYIGIIYIYDVSNFLTL